MMTGMTGLKEALQYAAGLREEGMKPEILEIGGKTYCTRNLQRYHHFDMADELAAGTLTAVVDYIKGKPEELRDSMILHVVGPACVRLYSGLVDERNREYLVRADAVINEFKFGSYYDQESFLIGLQANFLETHDLLEIMRVAGNIRSGTTANYYDDGVSQKTTVSTGAQLSDVIVPNPVCLRPFRTFAEIEQPESRYVFRIKDTDNGPAFKLVEAEGGLWKYSAMRQIKQYFEYELSGELERLHITVIA